MYIYCSTIKRNGIKIPDTVVKAMGIRYDHQADPKYDLIYHIPDSELDNASKALSRHNLRWVEVTNKPEWYYFDLLSEYDNEEYLDAVNTLAFEAAGYLANWNGITPYSKPRKTKAGGYISISATYPVQYYIPESDEAWFGSSKWFEEFPDGIDPHARNNYERLNKIFNVEGSDVIGEFGDAIKADWNTLYLKICNQLGTPTEPIMYMGARIDRNYRACADVEVKIWLFTHPTVSASDKRVGIAWDWEHGNR